MSMLDLAVFYDPGNWTRLFWAYGPAYTIVPGRHIGTDITTWGQPKPVPALLSGPVVGIYDTDNLGHVIVQDVSQSGSVHKYLSYCHMSGYDLPRLGGHLYQGDLFGKIATGPKSLGPNHPNYPGSSWTGAHLHLVWHNKPFGAFRLGQNDTYGNPETLITNVLSTPASGGGTTPFNPKEWDEMASKDEIKAAIQEVVGTRLGDGPGALLAVHCPELLDGWVFLLGPGYIKNAPGDQGHNYASITKGEITTLTAQEMIWEMWNHALGNVFPSGSKEELQAFLHGLGGGKFYVSPFFGGDGIVHE